VKRRVSAVVTLQRQREAGAEYKNDSLEKAIYPTILADPEVPESEKDLSRLQDDAIFLMVAGTDLPAQALAITMFHILNNPKVYQKLKEELFSGIPDINTTPTLEELERLPYLVSWLYDTIFNCYPNSTLYLERGRQRMSTTFCHRHNTTAPLGPG
jgi:hypothetical protein